MRRPRGCRIRPRRPAAANHGTRVLIMECGGCDAALAGLRCDADARCAKRRKSGVVAAALQKNPRLRPIQFSDSFRNYFTLLQLPPLHVRYISLQGRGSNAVRVTRTKAARILTVDKVVRHLNAGLSSRSGGRLISNAAHPTATSTLAGSFVSTLTATRTTTFQPVPRDPIQGDRRTGDLARDFAQPRGMQFPASMGQVPLYIGMAPRRAGIRLGASPKVLRPLWGLDMTGGVFPLAIGGQL
jgi:hypothetical protein